MAKEIKWTKTAAKNFDKVIDYLENNWPEKVVRDFVNRTSDLLDLLSELPEIGEVQDKNRQIRGILITKHNKLFYRIDKNVLIVLKIFDTRKNPKKLRFR
jgi:plasmid stabilization system protein ParE